MDTSKNCAVVWTKRLPPRLRGDVVSDHVCAARFMLFPYHTAQAKLLTAELQDVRRELSVAQNTIEDLTHRLEAAQGEVAQLTAANAERQAEVPQGVSFTAPSVSSLTSLTC